MVRSGEMNRKVLYYSPYSSESLKLKFNSLLIEVKRKAKDTKVTKDIFYTSYIFTMGDGSKYEYLYDRDNAIPYCIEKIK